MARSSRRAMDVTLNRGGETPLYLQIGEQLRSMIVEGKLSSGSRLPPIRSLARQLAVSKITVWQAYGALQEQGLATSVVGRGTIVSTSMPKQTTLDFLGSLTSRGPLSSFEEVSDSIGLRSLASSVPDPKLFHMDEFLSECFALQTASPWTFYHSPPAGATELHGAILDILRHRGIEADETQIIVTSGGTHARFLAASCLANPGDCVMVAEPGFLNAGELFTQTGLTPISISATAGTLDLEAICRAVRDCGAKLLFVSPTFGSVDGQVMRDSDRALLVELAHRLDFVIVEDDSYLWLDYGGRNPRPLASFDKHDRVVTIDSFSYCLSPGIRVGYLRCPARYRDRLLQRLRCEWMSGPQFVQIALARYIRRGTFEAHLRRVVPKYRARRDAMASALSLAPMQGCEWQVPQGGLAFWVKLPIRVDISELYERALCSGVAFAPGALISLAPEANQHMRLTFGTQSCESIRMAVQTLGELISKA